MRYPKIISFGLFLTLLGGCRGQQADPKEEKPERPKAAQGPGLIWKVSSNTTTIYLVGSIHVGKKEYFPLPAEVENAFAECTTLVVELDPSVHQMAAAQMMLAEGTY